MVHSRSRWGKIHTSSHGSLMDASCTGGQPASHAKKLLASLPEWQLQSRRADFLDWLYELYDRNNAPLGLRGTYTGLWQQYQSDLAELAFASYATVGLKQCSHG